MKRLITGCSGLRMISGCYLFLFEDFIKSGLDVFGLPVELHDITVVHQIAESLDYLFEAFGRKALQLFIAYYGSAHLLLLRSIICNRLLPCRICHNRYRFVRGQRSISLIHNRSGGDYSCSHGSCLFDSGIHFRSINIQ